MVFLLQVGKGKNFWFVVGPVHIVYLKGLEIADHDPAGLLRLGQIPAVPPSLLERRQHGSVRLAFTLFEVDLHTLLLNQDASGREIAVNIFRGGRSIAVVNLYPFFKLDHRCGLFNAAYFAAGTAKNAVSPVFHRPDLASQR